MHLDRVKRIAVFLKNTWLMLIMVLLFSSINIISNLTTPIEYTSLPELVTNDVSNIKNDSKYVDVELEKKWRSYNYLIPYKGKVKKIASFYSTNRTYVIYGDKNELEFNVEGITNKLNFDFENLTADDFNSESD